MRSSGWRTLKRLTPSSEGLGFNFTCPLGFRIKLHVTTLLSKGGFPVKCSCLRRVSGWFSTFALVPVDRNVKALFGCG